MSCAPNVLKKTDYSCFTYEELLQIAKALNITFEHKTLSHKELWLDIYEKLKNICDNEQCWSRSSFIEGIKDPIIRKKIKYFTFKPKMPETMSAWLSTKDINAILQQYELLTNSFLFLGAQPSDFYKLAKIDYNTLRRFKIIGLVLNLDSHYKAGSHWVALVIDNRIKSIEYFDSVGRNPNKNIQSYINVLKTQFPNYVVRVNKEKHQYKNSECGVYSVYYIVQRILGKTFEEITKHIVHDDVMNIYRKLIFS